MIFHEPEWRVVSFHCNRFDMIQYRNTVKRAVFRSPRHVSHHRHPLKERSQVGEGLGGFQQKWLFGPTFPTQRSLSWTQTSALLPVDCRWQAQRCVPWRLQLRHLLRKSGPRVESQMGHMEHGFLIHMVWWFFIVFSCTFFHIFSLSTKVHRLWF